MRTTLVKWAQQMIKDNSKFIRLARILEERTGIVGKVDNCNQDNTPGISICRHRLAEIRCRQKKPGRNKRFSNPMGVYKYGAKVPKNTSEALAIDKAAGNTVARCYWQRGRRPHGDGDVQTHAFGDQG
jgi:hypothetical protein